MDQITATVADDMDEHKIGLDFAGASRHADVVGEKSTRDARNEKPVSPVSGPLPPGASTTGPISEGISFCGAQCVGGPAEEVIKQAIVAPFAASPLIDLEEAALPALGEPPPISAEFAPGASDGVEGDID